LLLAIVTVERRFVKIPERAVNQLARIGEAAGLVFVVVELGHKGESYAPVERVPAYRERLSRRGESRTLQRYRFALCPWYAVTHVGAH